MKIIFLDVDGVLNSDEYFDKIIEKLGKIKKNKENQEELER